MKRFILSLCVGFFGIISFCSATVYDTYSGFCHNKDNFCKRATYFNLSNCNGDYYLLFLASGDVNWELRMPGTSYLHSSTDKFYGKSFDCSTYIQFSLVDRSTNGFDYVLKIVDYDEILNIGNSGGGSCPECPTCPEVNTGEILSGYILESEIDNLYCEEHGYCPFINTGDIIGSGDNWSALFINEIQHPSAPLINITIPEEFDWTYTGNEEEYNVDIKGFNVDTEYIDGIIRNQTTLPNKTDFNNTISGLIPLLVPGLVIIMFFIFIFRFIKKIF